MSITRYGVTPQEGKRKEDILPPSSRRNGSALQGRVQKMEGKTDEGGRPRLSGQAHAPNVRGLPPLVMQRDTPRPEQPELILPPKPLPKTRVDTGEGLKQSRVPVDRGHSVTPLTPNRLESVQAQLNRIRDENPAVPVPPVMLRPVQAQPSRVPVGAGHTLIPEVQQMRAHSDERRNTPPSAQPGQQPSKIPVGKPNERRA